MRLNQGHYNGENAKLQPISRPPIRRYSRSSSGLGLFPAKPVSIISLKQFCDHISDTERIRIRSADAER